MALESGTRLGAYDVLRPIGQGGMGEVYRARDTRLDRDVAPKILPESFALDAWALFRADSAGGRGGRDQDRAARLAAACRIRVRHRRPDVD